MSDPDSKPLETPDEALTVSPRVPRARLACYLVILALGVTWGASRDPFDPTDDIDELLAKVHQSSGAKGLYRVGIATAGFYPGHGYSLTLYVGGSARFAPARFLIVSRIDGVRTGELMIRVGPGGVRRIQGAELDAYLRAARLDLAPLEAAYRAYYAPRADLGKQ